MTLLAILAQLLVLLLSACSIAADPRVERALGAAPRFAGTIAATSGSLRRAAFAALVPAVPPLRFCPFGCGPGRQWRSIAPP